MVIQYYLILPLAFKFTTDVTLEVRGNLDLIKIRTSGV